MRCGLSSKLCTGYLFLFRDSFIYLTLQVHDYSLLYFGPQLSFIINIVSLILVPISLDVVWCMLCFIYIIRINSLTGECPWGFLLPSNVHCDTEYIFYYTLWMGCIWGGYLCHVTRIGAYLDWCWCKSRDSQPRVGCASHMTLVEDFQAGAGHLMWRIHSLFTFSLYLSV